MPSAIIAIGIAVASIIGFLAIVGMPSISYEKQDPVLSEEQVCDEQNNCSGIYTETTESKPKLVFKPIYEMSEQDQSEQNQAVVEDPSAKYYAETPIENTCKLNESTSRQGYYTSDGMFREKDVRTGTLHCTFADKGSSATQVSEDKIDLVKSRLPYCNEVIQHRSVNLDGQPMTRCLYDLS